MNSKINEIDAAYQPFPSFEDWAGASYPPVDWTHRNEELKALRQKTGDQFKNALNAVQRAAAVDTGAIEDLYKTDRGFTITVAKMTATWESEADEKGPSFRDNFEAQLQTYERLLDLATEEMELTEHLVREIHETICAGQEWYWANVETAGGTSREKRTLIKGEYKKLSNHVKTTGGTYHSYAPVLDTSPEMARLIEQTRTVEFQSAPPELQISYVHYAFVCIHPFADGNGRVARALASIFTYRHFSLPYFLGAEKREQYFEALSNADEGDHGSFVSFCISTIIDGIQFLNDAFSWPLDTSRADVQAEAIQSIFKTTSGFTHQEVDKAATTLLETFQGLIATRWQEAKIDPQYADFTQGRSDAKRYSDGITRPDGYRLVIKNKRDLLQLVFTTMPPARASIQDSIIVWVPKDCGEWDELILKIHAPADADNKHSGALIDNEFKVRVAEAMNGHSKTLVNRLNTFADGYFSSRLEELQRRAKNSVAKTDT